MLVHTPVLRDEVLRFLDPKDNENFVDATCGSCGHTALILERNGPHGKVLAIDKDPDQLVNCQERLKGYLDRVILANDNFANLEKIVQKHNFRPVHGILMDLGLSSWHLEKSGKGFSFQRDEPLNMAYGNTNDLTAYKIVNTWRQEDLQKIFKDYGQERFASPIAKAIVQARQKKPIERTGELAKIIERAIPSYFRHKKKIHPATLTFQAIRIAVNQELENISQALPKALECLETGGRLAIISFHSLEDRLVKNFFRETEKNNLAKILTKKPVRATAQEIALNPRARSAKLRAIKKL